MARYPSKSSTRKGSVFLNPGGPGGPGKRLVTQGGEGFRDLVRVSLTWCLLPNV